MKQQLELRRRQHHLPPVDRRLHARHVEAEGLADPDYVILGAGAARAPQHGAHPGHHLAGAEGLGHVVVGAQLEAGDAVRLLGAGGQHDDRHVAVAAEGPGNVQAVELGEGEVEDDQVGVAAAGDLQGLLPVTGGEDLETGALQVVAHQPHDVGLVVDDEHRGHRAHRRGCAGLAGRPPLALAARRQNGPVAFVAAGSAGRRVVGEITVEITVAAGCERRVSAMGRGDGPSAVGGGRPRRGA